MSNSPPGAKGSRASSGGKRSGGGQKSTPGKNKNKKSGMYTIISFFSNFLISFHLYQLNCTAPH